MLYLLKSAALISLFYLVYILLLKKDTFFTAHRVFLLFGMAVASLLPLLSIEYTSFIHNSPLPLVIQDNLPYPIHPITAQITTLTQPTFNFDYIQILTIIYLIGVTVMIVRFLSQLLALRALIKSGFKVVQGRYTLVEATAPITPFSFFNYIVYNPSHQKPSDLKIILSHERVHSRQLHSLDVVLAQIMIIVQWCNPIAWLYKKVLEENIEYIADFITVKKLPSKKEYQWAMLRASSPLQPPLTLNFYQSFIKKRIIMLNTPTSRKRNLWKIGIVLPFLALFMYSFTMKEVVSYVEDDFEIDAFAKANKVLLEEYTLSTDTLKKSNIKKTATIPVIGQKPINKGAQREGANPSILSSNTKVQSKNTTAFKPLNYQPMSDIQTTYQFVITKDHTPEELDLLATRLKKDHNALLIIKDVDYNEQQEITSIRLDFKDAQGNNKNYTVQSPSPISDIYIYRDALGRTGISNAGATGSTTALRDRMDARFKRISKDRDSIRAQMDKRQKEMRSRINRRKKESNLRATALRDRNDSLYKVFRARRDSSLKGRATNRYRFNNKPQKNRKDSLSSSKNKPTRYPLKSGTIYLDGNAYNYTKNKIGEITYHDKWGTEITTESPVYDRLKEAPTFFVDGEDSKDDRQRAFNLLGLDSHKKEPLILLDGKVITRQEMNKLDEDEIANISILKGKTATAAQGKAGVNGVIIIEMKE